MNKSFARFAAAGLAAVSFFAFSACGGQNPDVTGGGGNNPAMPDYGVGLSVVGTVTPDPNAPTEEPTEAPSEAPTAEPTATPIPEGWYIDPRGIIPPEVEVLVPDADNLGTQSWCITKVDGKTTLQMWSKQGLQKQWEVPDEFLNATSIGAADSRLQDGDIWMVGWITEPYEWPAIMFYQDKEGRTLSFKYNGVFADTKKMIIATSDGKIIRYEWGNDYYEMHDFGPEHDVTLVEAAIYVDGQWRSWTSITLSKIPF